MWVEIFSCNDLDNCIYIFLSKVNNFVNISTKKIVNSKNKRIKESMTAELLCSVHVKQHLSLKAKKNYPDNIKLISYYYKYKNK